MDSAVVAQLALFVLLPAVFCALLLFLRRLSGIANIPELAWQVIVGIFFGIVAIYYTHSPVPLTNANVYLGDIAPIAAGLIFGGPAGIIAGCIGGLECLAVPMDGTYAFTQLACSFGMISAGIYAALLRWFLFENDIPNLAFAFATGVVVEVSHLLLVLLTNFDQAELAFQFVEASTLSLVICVSLAALLCSLVVSLIERRPLITPADERTVTRILHARLLTLVVIAFLVTMAFTAVLQTNLSRAETTKLLELNITDVEREIIDASDSNLLRLTQRAAAFVKTANSATNEQCEQLADDLDVAEINVVNAYGIITATTEKKFVGFDMRSGEQSAEFLVLLEGNETQYVQSYRPISYDANTSRKYAGVVIEDGFIQVGYDAENFLDDLTEQIEVSVKNRHVGQTGVLAVIDESGNIISTYNGAADIASDQLSADAQQAGTGQLFTTRFADTECFASYQEVEGYRIIALLPTEEANASRDASMLLTAFMEALVFTALLLIIYAVLKQVVVRGVREMNHQLDEIASGNLDVMLDVRTASEFSSLSDNINQTVGVLKESLSLVKADLNLAASIQANTLPDITSAIASRNEFELYATMEPAREVGGDFYDFFMVDEDHLALVVADVSGKGVPAAMFMMQSKAIIKMEALSGSDPASVLEKANADLSEKNDDDMFTTAWLGVLEISTGNLTYADAGHEKLALRINGTWEIPAKPNGAIALASFTSEDYNELPEKYHFRNHTIQLRVGDAIVQYTDGVTEANNAQDELFEEHRLLQALSSVTDDSSKTMLKRVQEEIDAFTEGNAQFDDITMLGLVYKGNNHNELQANASMQ